MGESDNLMPCPVCGAAFLMSQEPHDNHPVAGKFYIYHEYGPLRSAARSCPIAVNTHFETAAEAIAAWNFRAPITQPDANREVIDRIARIAMAVGLQAGVGASEVAGQIVSVLHANPEHIGRFMIEGSELFIDGTFSPENGCLTYLAMNGEIVSPAILRQRSGRQQ